jgi:triosephosphate isomerase
MTIRPWPRRPRFVAGNWKMHKTSPEAAALTTELVELLRARASCEVALCPPFPALDVVGQRLANSGIHLGAQNLHWEPQGAFTGEVSGLMLRASGCRLVIVGHSERRHGMGEDDATVARKMRAALRDGLTPIVCVGETLAERDAGREAEVLVRQIQAAFDGLSAAEVAGTVIAYEPVWAIGTGRVATPEQARDAHRVIRSTLDRVAGAGSGPRMAILYGGSVNAENAASLFAEEELDGALVGGASLQTATFWKIVAAAAQPARAV